MTNPNLSSVTLTTDQIWVLAESLNRGPLPQALMIIPHPIIFDTDIFHRDIRASLRKANIIDHQDGIHPLVESWLNDLCTLPTKLNITINENNHTTRIAMVYNSQQHIIYLAVASNRVICGKADIYDIPSLLAFIRVGKYNKKPANFERCEIAKDMVAKSINNIVFSDKEYGVRELQDLVASFHLPQYLLRLSEYFGESNAKNHTATFLLTHSDGEEQLTKNPTSMSIISTPDGKIVVYQDTTSHNHDILVYEPGTTENITTGFSQLFTADNLTPWFS